MNKFGEDPRAFFEAIYQDIPPWDINGPQPSLTALLEEYPPPEPLLDVGCGSGDLAIWLAGRGLRVLGVDLVEAPIAQAREKAAALPPEVASRLEFQVADALHPGLLGRQFGAVVDSGFYHLFGPEQRDRFAGELAEILLPGGRYYILAFAVEFDLPNTPRKVTREDLQERFTAERGWRFVDVRDGQFLSRVAPPVPAIAACIEY